MNITVGINREAAIKAGKEQWGEVIVDLDLAPLTPEQREVVATIQSNHNLNKFSPWSSNIEGGIIPILSELPDQDKLVEIINARIECNKKREDIAKENAQRKAKENEERVWEIINTPMNKLVEWDYRHNSYEVVGYLQQYQSTPMLASFISTVKKLAEIKTKEGKVKEERHEFENKQQKLAKRQDLQSFIPKIDGLGMLLRYERVEQAQNEVLRYLAEKVSCLIELAGWDVITWKEMEKVLGEDIDWEGIENYKGEVPIEALKELQKYESEIDISGNPKVYFPEDKDEEDEENDPMLIVEHNIERFGKSETVRVEIYRWGA